MFKIFTTFSLLVSFTVLSQGIDPTKPLGFQVLNAQQENQSYTLYSVLSIGNERSAIINNRTLGEGDLIGDFTVKKITNDTVTLSNQSETLQLSLFNQAAIN